MRLGKFARPCAGLLMLLFAAGCTTYYRVTDQSTRRSYYTTDIDRTESGAVRFYDEKSRASVTLQSSEIVEISKEAFSSGIRE
ncbi:MAG TPA: hypothetical protein VF353_00215 [Candidatus Binatia bacterium]